MAISFQFFADPALTTPIRSGPMFTQFSVNPEAADCVVYFGSPLSASVAKASSDPGVDEILIEVASGGVGMPATVVKLADSLAGLDAAVGGAALSLGVSLSSGQENAVSVHIRVLDSTPVAGLYSNLAITVSEIEETT